MPFFRGRLPVARGVLNPYFACSRPFGLRLRVQRSFMTSVEHPDANIQDPWFIGCVLQSRARTGPLVLDIDRVACRVVCA